MQPLVCASGVSQLCTFSYDSQLYVLLRTIVVKHLHVRSQDRSPETMGLTCYTTCDAMLVYAQVTADENLTRVGLPRMMLQTRMFV